MSCDDEYWYIHGGILVFLNNGTMYQIIYHLFTIFNYNVLGILCQNLDSNQLKSHLLKYVNNVCTSVFIRQYIFESIFIVKPTYPVSVNTHSLSTWDLK